MLSTILVPLDGSPFAERALAVAQGLAQGTPARLILVRVVHVLAIPGIDSREEQWTALADAQKYLDATVARLRPSHLVSETAVPYGDAAAEILLEIDLRSADLVVMATHGRSGVGRWLYGSVADQILRRANVPIVLVPPAATHLWPTDRRPVILVALDGSTLAEAALAPATALAMSQHAQLVLLRVVPLPSYVSYGEAGAYAADDTDAYVSGARSDLLTLAQPLRSCVESVRVRTEVGDPATCIAQAARDEQADMICMATHGRSGLTRLVLGSVASGVLGHAQAPVLLVRPASGGDATRAERPVGDEISA